MSCTYWGGFCQCAIECAKLGCRDTRGSSTGTNEAPKGADSDSKATSLEPGASEQDAKKGSGEQAGSTPDETLREALTDDQIIVIGTVWFAEITNGRGTAGAIKAIRRALATPTKPEMQSVHPAAVSGKEKT